MSDAFSYSKIDTYKKCPFKYKLIYVEKHLVKSDTVSTDFGSLVHYIEEQIGKDIKEGRPIPYDTYKDLFMTIKEEKVAGVNTIKERYPKEWYEVDKNGMSHDDKATAYLNHGIYYLENFLKNNPHLSLYAMELPFYLTIHNKDFRGFIDRIYFNKSNGSYLIEDIKTYTTSMKSKDLKNSLQMYVYEQALKTIIGPDVAFECQYSLPLISVTQKSIVDKKYIQKNLDYILQDIDAGQFHPKPSPLCHWCVFSKTYPNQPEEAKNLCPYFCHWTKENKTDTIENEWQGESMHPVIMENFIKKNGGSNL